MLERRSQEQIFLNDKKLSVQNCAQEGSSAWNKVINSVWAIKKKSSGTLCGRLNARGFKQIKGQQYDGTTISSPVTNSATIRIVLVLMVMASMIAHIVDVKEAFLHGGFEDGEKVHMAIPRGFEKHFSSRHCHSIVETPLWT